MSIFFLFNLIILKKKLQPCLNQRNKLGIVDTWYMTSDFSSKGDLIIESFNYPIITNITGERYFFGLKRNGRPLFYEQEKGFINQKMLKTNFRYFKFESQLSRIELANNDEKDYYLSSSFSNFTIEIIDFYNNKITGIPLGNIFTYSDWASVYFNILKLNNEKKTCVIKDKISDISKFMLFLGD